MSGELRSAHHFLDTVTCVMSGPRKKGGVQRGELSVSKTRYPDPTLSISAARILVILIMSVVVSFVFSTAVSQYRTVEIDRRVAEIVANAMPSVQNLSRARTALKLELDLIRELSKASSANIEQIQERILANRQDLQMFIRTYQTFPYFPSEPEIALMVAEKLPELDRAADRYLQSYRSKGKGADAALLDQVMIKGSGVERSLSRLLEFNAKQGQRLGLEISTIRMQSFSIVIALDLLSIVLAILAAAKSVTVFRNSVHVLEDRASELEFFAGRVAHDLKNPLNVIKMAAALGEKSQSTEELHDCINKVGRNAIRMNHLIEGLLEFAQSGARPSPGEPVDVTQVVNDVVAAVLYDSKETGVDFKMEGMDNHLSVRCTIGALTSSPI